MSVEPADGMNTNDPASLGGTPKPPDVKVPCDDSLISDAFQDDD